MRVVELHVRSGALRDGPNEELAALFQELASFEFKSEAQHLGQPARVMPVSRGGCSHVGRFLKERLQKEDKGGHIILESIIFSLRYKAGPQGALLNPKGGARFAIDGR